MLEGAFRQNTIYTKYEIISNSTDQVIESGDVELPYQSLAFRQAYVDIYPIKGVTIAAGKQTIVWGQLDIFSPVDFLLPIDINPMGFSLVKADNRMPQTTVKVSYYPLSNVEFSGYLFPTYEESPLFKNIDMGVTILNIMVLNIMLKRYFRRAIDNHLQRQEPRGTLLL